MATTQPNLVIQTAFLGDLLLAIPLLKRIKQLRPASPLYLVCRKGLGRLMLDLRLVDRVFEIEKSKWETYKKNAQQLSAQEIDWLISPHMSFTTARFVGLLKARQKVSYSQWWNFVFYDQRLKKNKLLPDALRQLSLLQLFDLENKERLLKYAQTIPIETLGPVPEWASMSCREVIQSWDVSKPIQGNYICFFPGSVWATKQWTEPGFAQTAQQLQKKNFKIIWMGGPGEESIGERLSQQVPDSINLIAKTSLQESLAILADARLIIANDSSGQHLAAVAGVPSVSIFGPTVPAFGFRPWNPQAKIVENIHIDCRPCGPHGHRKCPQGHHNCMKSISSDEVLKAAQSFLN